MNNRDWEQFGNDILRTVQEAVESCNYDKLNQNVGDAVNQVVESVTKNVKNMSQTMNQRQASQKYENSNNIKYGKSQKAKLLKNSNLIHMPSKAWAVILTVLGYVGALYTGFSSFALLIALIFEERIFTTLIVSLAAFAGCMGAGLLGTSLISRINRFKKYVKEIGSSEFCKISDLAARVKKTEKYVVKDLEKMIKKDWFLQGHLDRQKTCIIVTNQMYEQYKQLEQRSEMQRLEDEKRRQEEIQKKQALSPEVQKVVEQGDIFIKKIRACNDAIPGEEISAKIARMEMIVDRIFERVEQNPQSVKDVRKLMEYYLPTTVKLLEAYAEMDSQPVGGENIETAKKEIEATLDTLNAAFEKILDGLFQEKAWDVSSDISVLNTMLAQEGLKEDGLKIRR